MIGFRAGTGYDSHRLEEGRKLYIGGVEIPHYKGCVAHSDGDVLIHALCDALFGAAGLKDIGSHFPDTDPQFQNIDSKILLSRTIALLHQQNWEINNVDSTVLLEKPKLSPYINEMIAILSSILQISPSSLSIKAKTNEKMGFVGQEDGIVAMVTVTIKKSLSLQNKNYNQK